MSNINSKRVLNNLNLGSVLCPKCLCVNSIEHCVGAMQNQTGAAVSVQAIADGQVEAMEFRVDANANHCGVPLKNLKPRANVLIASITHGSQTEIPNGNSMFHQGDTLVVVTSQRGSVRHINDIFT